MIVSGAEIGLVLTELKRNSGNGILWAGFIFCNRFSLKWYLTCVPGHTMSHKFQLNNYLCLIIKKIAVNAWWKEYQNTRE